MRPFRIAAKSGLPLKIAAKVDRVDEEYFKTEIEPLLPLGDVEFIGEIREDQKQEFLGNAAGLLFPIAWREPFGLVMIEAMACGTPVVAFENGSVPEVLEHGVTGYIVHNEEEAIRAVARIGDLDRRRIRREFERRFTAQRMAQNYLKLYSQLARKAALAGRGRGAGILGRIPGAIAGNMRKCCRRESTRKRPGPRDCRYQGGRSPIATPHSLKSSSRGSTRSPSPRLG